MREFFKVRDKEYYLDINEVISTVETNEGEMNIGKFDIIRMWVDQFVSLNDFDSDVTSAEHEQLTDSGKIMWNTLLKYNVLKEINEDKKYFKKVKI
jgi:hypothetical protein